MSDDDRIVAVATYYDVHEARLVCSQLESRGIRAMVQTDTAGGIEPHLAWTNGVQLMVRSADAERARKLLDSVAG